MSRLATGGLIVIFLALLGCKEGYEKGFKQGFEKEFVKSCVDAAVKNGAKEADSLPVCECTAKNLVEKHDSGELTKIGASPNAPESKKILGEAVAACAKK